MFNVRVDVDTCFKQTYARAKIKKIVNYYIKSRFKSSSGNMCKT